MSWIDLRDSVSWADYMCLLAISLDKEELELYQKVQIQHGSKAVKNWKWQSPDKAGTIPLARGDTLGVTAIPAVSDALKTFKPKDDVNLRLKRFYDMTFREYVFDLGNGLYETKGGETIEELPEDMTVFPIAIKNAK